MTPRSPWQAKLSWLRQFMPSAARKMSVLLLAADPLVGERLGAMLPPVATVTRVRSWEAALAASGPQRTDLVVLAVSEPTPSTWRAFERFRLAPQLRAAPVLVISGPVSVAHKIEAFAAGADDYLVEPFGAETLRAHMRRLQQAHQLVGWRVTRS